MIFAVSLNPCIDKTASVDRFCLDAPNRIRVERVDLGGKGVNVARVIHALGGEGMLVGFDYQHQPVAAALTPEEVPCCLQPVPGQLRVNMKLKETETGRTIEINEQGAEAAPEAVTQLMETLFSLAAPGDWISLSGSLPPGAPADTYARFVQAAREHGCFAAVDCDGAALQAALTARPALIKPNAQEFEALTGVNAGNEEAALEACRTLINQGVGIVCLSRGEQGALLVSGEGAWACPAAQIAAQGTQGAGDSLLGALLLALNRGTEPGEALRFASAAAGASVMRPGTLLCSREDTEALLAALPASKKRR